LLPFPKQKYGVIYADPPWAFQTWSDGGKGRSAENHYECMTMEDIRSLPVSSISEANCALFLWSTDPLLPAALKMIEAWGFKFKTIAFVWAKLNKSAPELFSADDFFTGMGYWTRANPELCLLATKGKPQRHSKSVRRLIIERRREHSRKPDEVANRITELMGSDTSKIELFARQSRIGWDAWGYESEKFS